MAINPEEMARAQEVLASVRDEWLQRPGVTAVDLGFKWSEGQMTGELAIRVHLAQKKPLSELSENELFPREVEGIAVDVIEATYGIQLLPEGNGLQLEAAVDGRDGRFDPIPLGVSIGNPMTTAGTLGAKVVDATTGVEMVLSNWHVMVGTADPAPDMPIWQPGKLDGGRAADTFATLTRHVLGPYDAAVATLNGSRMVEVQTLEGDSIVEATTPMLGMSVWKSGRTTGRTEGFIDGVMMSLAINYSVGQRTLQSVFRVIPRPGAGNVEVSMGGDSGSIWVDEASGKGVGLHFAGETGSGPEQALAHDLPKVLQYLNIQMPVQTAPPPEPPSTEPSDLPPGDPHDEPKSFWQKFLEWLVGLFG